MCTPSPHLPFEAFWIYRQISASFPEAMEATVSIPLRSMATACTIAGLGMWVSGGHITQMFLSSNLVSQDVEGQRRRAWVSLLFGSLPAHIDSLPGQFTAVFASRLARDLQMALDVMAVVSPEKSCKSECRELNKSNQAQREIGECQRVWVTTNLLLHVTWQASP